MCTNCNELKYQIICMDLNSLWEKVLCPQYKAELLINDGLAQHMTILIRYQSNCFA